MVEVEPKTTAPNEAAEGLSETPSDRTGDTDECCRTPCSQSATPPEGRAEEDGTDRPEDQ